MRAREPDADGFVDHGGVKLRSTAGWARYNRHDWLEHWEDFVEFFSSQCFTESHSTKQVEDGVGWGLEATPQVRSGAALARATGGTLVVVEGAGHLPNARDPVKVNLLIREFAESLPPGRAG
jgi:pimeloyl-ACP methyl ester carboxylesterase